MPQMAPISWFLLFIIFSITFILFNMMNYYIFLYHPTLKNFYSKKMNMKFIYWKW